MARPKSGAFDTAQQPKARPTRHGSRQGCRKDSFGISTLMFENRTATCYMMDIRTLQASLTMTPNLGYSENDLTADLRRWWDDQVADPNDPFAEPRPSRSGTIFDVVPAVDSLGVVEVLITIEKHVNCEVPVGIIRPGGYRNFEEMIADLLPKTRAFAMKQRKKEAA
jgi:hypothetical protein